MAKTKKTKDLEKLKDPEKYLVADGEAQRIKPLTQRWDL